MVNSQRKLTSGIVNFTNTENLDTGSRNFSFDFKTKSRKDLAESTFSLLDSEEKLITFSYTNENILHLDFGIGIFK